MPLSTFHPAVQRWFEKTFPAPSAPQAAGWPEIAAGRDTLIAAPTGSGKTLTAFLACLNDFFMQGLDGSLDDRTQVVYVSPLKALSNDIEKNLREPLLGIAEIANGMGLIAPHIRVAVRTGDTPAADRLKMTKTPPHILVTTPESLYILLTAEKSRQRLRAVKTVIVDEIHAVARDKRGSHLALSLERLDALCAKPPQRIGLSATQRPVELVAKFLVGSKRLNADGSPRCAIVDLGHLRKIDLSIEIPPLPLSHVASMDLWSSVYDRLTQLVKENRTTLIFVNTRSLCERLAHHLEERVGAEKVGAHHGSLSRGQRLRSEEKLKAGELSALVATSSLELGIDIGSIDLVCQIGITASIGAILQRAGRAGHNLASISRGKIFPLTLDDLCTSAALCAAVRRGNMDTLSIPENALDILAQQIVAASAAEEWNEDELFDMCRGAYPYRALERKVFDEVVQMLEDGFSTKRGRRSALIHHDAIGKRIRGRRGARLAAITCGGAIPDAADYAVVQEPEGLKVGTLDEHFAVESSPGDIFQLGNTTWRILKVETARVRVEDAKGQPPTLPFWFGEAPARSDELSRELTRQRAEIETILETEGLESAIRWLMDECGLVRSGAEQIAVYLADTKKTLGVLPTLDTLVLERFFDESGGMQLILHAPFGRRVNWAWGLALRKRFCRGFNFELQAAASENSILLSLGPQHSFPLADVFNYLSEKTVEPLLIQAALEAPVFQTRWRWDACRSLALLRFSSGKKVPPHLLRMRSEDLLCAVFPHAAACPETLEGDREVPDHPLVREVIHDCLHEAMDIVGLKSTLNGIATGRLKLVARDTIEPSALAGEILAAKLYSFLDDADINERRTRAVYSRRSLSVEDAQGIGALDANAIARVRDECRPDARDADELHDALMTCAYLTPDEMQPFATPLSELLKASRACVVSPYPSPLTPLPQEERGTGNGDVAPLYIASERVPWFEAIYWGTDGLSGRDAQTTFFEPAPSVPAKERAKQWTRETALVEVVRGRIEISGPATAAHLAREMSVELKDIDQALLTLETQGVVMRGNFSPGVTELEWCDRRLLSRIHRYTLDRLRREIEPVTAANFVRFLFSWQHVDPATQLDGPRGVSEAIAQLQGFEIAAASWERDVLRSRVRGYDKRWLDQLSLSGEISWGRRFPTPPNSEGKRHSGQIRNTSIGLLLRDQHDFWLALAPALPDGEMYLSSAARAVLAQLHKRGAMFFQNLTRETKRLPVEIETALGELVAFGLVTGDGFGGLRALLVSASQRRKLRNRDRHARQSYAQQRFSIVPKNRLGGGIETAGRWSLFRGDGQPNLFGGVTPEEALETVARQLLRRWGVVFHRVLAREKGLPPWLDLLKVYRRLEARGEIRGGRFVAGFSGEQYALPEAVEHLRAIRGTAPDGTLRNIGAADPLNVAGILTPGEKIAARAATQVLFRDGVPVAVKEAGHITILQIDAPSELKSAIQAALARRA